MTRPPPRAGPGAALPGVRARLERLVLRRADRHPDAPVVAPRRVRAGDPLLRGRRASRSPTWSPPRAFEGGDLVLPAARGAADRPLRGAHPEAGRASRWRAGSRSSGWEVRLQPFDPHFVHIDVIVCMVAPGLAVICAEARAARARRTGCGRIGARAARGRPTATCMALGANVMALGERPGDLHRGGRGAQRAAARARPHGLRPRPVAVHDGRRRAALPGPAAAPRGLSGGARARDRRPARARPPDRRARAARAGCAGPTSGSAAREFLRELLAELPVEVSSRRRGQPLGRAGGRRRGDRRRSARTSTRCPPAAGSTARWA